MPHTIYNNFFLSNEVEDMYKSRLNLQNFCKVDNDLVGVPGMIRKINRYTATDGTEKLAMGKGNTKSIEVSYTQKDYTILLAQNRFEYYDEQEMTDPNLVLVGMQKMGIDLFNTVNDDVFAEYNKAPVSQTITLGSGVGFGFDCFADAVALLNIEGTDNDPATVAPRAFAFVHPKDVAKVRKALKDELKYVEAFVRTGYVGTVAGVNIFTKKNAVEGTIVGGTKDAVTLFNKKGVEVVQSARSSDDENIRLNTIYARKYYLAALTDETKCFKIVTA